MRSSALAAVLIGTALPAAAQQASPLPQERPATAPLMLLPHPTEAGKPVVYDPLFAAEADRAWRLGCAPAPSCRVRLLGVVEKNGAVALETTAFTW
ncbi:MAG TPA: hypothetical protein VGF34_20225 [Stellaceae bacterium]|jgi:hypothetical protein